MLTWGDVAAHPGANGVAGWAALHAEQRSRLRRACVNAQGCQCAGTMTKNRTTANATLREIYSTSANQGAGIFRSSGSFRLS